MKNTHPNFQFLDFSDPLVTLTTGEIVESIFSLGDRVLLYGPGSRWNTLAAISLALACATGKPFMSTQPKGRVYPINVAYLSSSGAVGLGQDFARSAAEGFDITESTQWPEELRVYPKTIRFGEDGSSSHSTAKFIEEWREFQDSPLDLLIIDNVVGYLSSPCNPDPYRHLTAGMDEITGQLGCAIVIVCDEFWGKHIVNDFDASIRVDEGEITIKNKRTKKSKCIEWSFNYPRLTSGSEAKL